MGYVEKVAAACTIAINENNSSREWQLAAEAGVAPAGVPRATFSCTFPTQTFINHPYFQER